MKRFLEKLAVEAPGERQAATRNYLDPYRILVAGLLFVSISRIHEHVPGMSALQPVLVLTVLAVGYAILRPSVVDLFLVFRYWPPRVMWTLLILACVAAPFGLSLGNSAAFILNSYVKVLVVVFLLIASIRTAKDLRFFAWSYVLACAVLVYFALFAFDLTTFADGTARLMDLYMYDSNDVAVLLLVGLPLAVLLMTTTTSSMKKVVAGSILAGIGVALARTGSRGAFIGLIISVLTFLVLAQNISLLKRATTVLLLAGALVLAAPSGFWQQMASLTQPTQGYNWQSYQGRRQLAKRGLGYMTSHPIFGVGINNFGRAEGTISRRARLFRGQPDKRAAMGYRLGWSAPHNSFIQVGAELGFPGLILWSSLLLGGIVGLRRLRRRLPTGWARGDPDERLLYGATLYLPISIVAFSVSAFFLSHAYMIHSYLLGALVTGTYAASDRLLTHTGYSTAGRGRSASESAARYARTSQSPSSIGRHETSVSGGS